MAIHPLEDTEGGTGIEPSPAVYDFLAQLLGRMGTPGPAQAGITPDAPPVGLASPVPRGVQANVADPGIPPRKPAIPQAQPPASPTGQPGGVTALDDAGLPNLDAIIETVLQDDTVGQQVPRADAQTPARTPSAGLVGGSGLDVPPGAAQNMRTIPSGTPGVPDPLIDPDDPPLPPQSAAAITKSPGLVGGAGLGTTGGPGVGGSGDALIQAILAILSGGNEPQRIKRSPLDVGAP